MQIVELERQLEVGNKTSLTTSLMVDKEKGRNNAIGSGKSVAERTTLPMPTLPKLSAHNSYLAGKTWRM